MLSTIVMAGLAVLTLGADRNGSMVELFSWLLGNWTREESLDGRPVLRNEHWIATDANRLVAEGGWLTRPAPAPDERIELRFGSGGPIFYVWTRDGVSRHYRMVSTSGWQVAFEDADGGPPQRIVYVRERHQLIRTLSAADGSNATSHIFNLSNDEIGRNTE